MDGNTHGEDTVTVVPVEETKGLYIPSLLLLRTEC